MKCFLITAWLCMGVCAATSATHPGEALIERVKDKVMALAQERVMPDREAFFNHYIAAANGDKKDVNWYAWGAKVLASQDGCVLYSLVNLPEAVRPQDQKWDGFTRQLIEEVLFFADQVAVTLAKQAVSESAQELNMKPEQAQAIWKGYMEQLVDFYDNELKNSTQGKKEDKENKALEATCAHFSIVLQKVPAFHVHENFVHKWAAPGCEEKLRETLIEYLQHQLDEKTNLAVACQLLVNGGKMGLSTFSPLVKKSVNYEPWDFRKCFIDHVQEVMKDLERSEAYTLERNEQTLFWRGAIVGLSSERQLRKMLFGPSPKAP